MYASLALIGRVVYFVAWMFVMLLLPEVVKKKKAGARTANILWKYVGYIGLLSASIVVVCFAFPKMIVNVMFGQAYLEVAHLLGPYALATGLFAVANLFTYYFLSLGKYRPVYFSLVGGALQISGVLLFHDQLLHVVLVQIATMLVLLLVQVVYCFKQEGVRLSVNR